MSITSLVADAVKRNDLCPCGSGLKYKKCCMEKDASGPEQARNYYRKHGIRLKTAEDVEGIRRSGRLVLELLELAATLVKPGAVTGDIDRILADYTRRHGAVSAPLHYRGYPRSTCISINDVICHGIPGERALAEGDIVNIDVTTVLDGYYADASKTFLVGAVKPEAARLVEVTRECLRRGMHAVKPGHTLGDIGWAIQSYAEAQGCSVVRDFVGHGIGLEFHEAPQIMHTGRRGNGIKLVPGMVFTIEPMINLGRPESRVMKDGWTALTVDGSLSAQFEQTILVTPEGFESLTPYEPEFFLKPV
ncbi:MAG TPA: type I methionyl aminopeptidase [Kiritimatiellia bacterium]|nr:type I methionyl aminopeptidase [Kiritimatiellia bacterium]HMO99999.1 type I methionyl aminopeptidase [Kiritimatiellia bacterium]HMP97391.1 type I methionyl aminopeptidase [Kiritimatiellia bacterium]